MSPASDFPGRNRRGAILPVIFMLMGLIAVVGYALLSYIERSFTDLMDEDTQIEAQMLASDIKELGKYLLLYEKVQFQKQPLALSPERRQGLETIWGQNFGSVSEVSGASLTNSCGGYSALVEFVGNLKLGADNVFCPAYIRNSQLSGPLLEKMLLDNWSRRGNAKIMQGYELVGAQMADVVDTPTGAGRYVVTMDLSGGNEGWMNDPANFVLMNFGQKIAQRAKQLGLSAELGYEIMTDTKGFIPSASERFIKVSAKVSFKGAARNVSFTDSDSLIMTVPTIKDFVIFMPYPTDKDGAPTSSFKASLDIPATARIFGRVYFNGDIDVKLEDLPTFTETVFISGGLTEVKNASGDVLKTLQAKFQKGIVTHFSAPRFLMDGACPGTKGVTGATVSINNQSGIYCERGGLPYGITNYINNLQSVCSPGTATVDTAGKVKFDFSKVTIPDPMAEQACNASDQIRFVSGGVSKVVTTGGYAFIASPVGSLSVNASQSYVHGVIVGGYVHAAEGTTFVSLARMTKGMPGLSTDAALGQRSADANAIYEGISAPLMNFPLVQNSKDGVN